MFFKPLRRAGLRAWFSSVVAVAILATPAVSFEPHSAAFPDFDAAGGIRVGLAPGEEPPPSKRAALGRIATRSGAELRLSFNALTKTPRKLTSGRPLSPPSKGAPEAVARTFMRDNAEVWGLAPGDVDRLVLKTAYTDRHSGVSHVYFGQEHSGVPVFTGVLGINLDAAGRVTSVVGDVWSQRPLEEPWILSREQAATAAVASVGVSWTAERASQSGDTVVFDRQSLLDDVRVERWVYPLLGEPRPAYRMTIDKSGLEWYDVLVDGATGDILHRRNLYLFLGTVAPSAPAEVNPAAPRGLVYVEHPLATVRGTGDLLRRYPFTADPTGRPRGFANAPLFGADVSPTNANGGSPVNATIDGLLLPFPSAVSPLRSSALPLSSSPQSPNGWFIPQSGNYVSFGNNVDAKEDHAADNEGSMGQRAVGGAAGDFSGPSFVYHNFYAQNGPYAAEGTLQPASAARKAGAAPDLNPAILTLFYASNWFHDLLYHLGFTEAAGNFQLDNFGLGGLGNDHVFADAQDGSGTNNANFGTPADGANPRMQMFLFSGPERDGTFDVDVIIHEYAHGLSNRLVGGPNSVDCLGTPLVGESGSMGEGWGDWFAAIVADEPAVGEYATGTGENGIRRFPMDSGPPDFTYGFLCTGPPSNPSLVQCEVHDGGEFWSIVLWEMRESMINRWHNRLRPGAPVFPTYGVAGSADGNIRNAQGRTLDGSGDPVETDHEAIENAAFEAMFRVTDGMKLAPCNPTMLDMRDAILEADRTAGGEHVDLIWRVFANRGAGEPALSTGGAAPTIVESFAVPATVAACEAAGGPLPAPVFTLSSNADNEVTVSIVPNGATEYAIFRSTVGAGSAIDPVPYVEVGRTSGTNLVDTGLDGGRTYWYRVRALRNDDCVSASSAADVVPQGAVLDCITQPQFQGVARALDMGDCEHLRLDWPPATSTCASGPEVSYNIYRSTSPAFPIDASTRIATGVAGTTFEDAPDQPDRLYYYVVRAEDSTTGHGGPANGGNEDDNTVVAFALVTSGALVNQGFEDDVESGPDSGASEHFTSSGLQVPTIPERGGWFRDADPAPVAPRSPQTVWHTFNPDNPVIGPNDSVVYELRSDVIPITPGSILTFHHTFQTEAGFDGGVVEYAIVLDETTGAVGPFEDLGALIYEGGYNGVLDATIEGVINNNPLANRRAFTGGSLGPMSRVRAFVGNLMPTDETEAHIVVRFLFGNDVANSADPTPTGNYFPGWYIDDVTVDQSCCPLSVAPTNLTATAGVGQITLDWDAPAGSIERYEIYREASNESVPAVFDERVATVDGDLTSWIDETVSTGVTYHYVVRAIPAGGCPSAESNAASASPLGGDCLAAPTFAGAERVSAPPDSTCALLVEWDPAQPNCFGATVSYNVYRSENPGFTPSPANLVARGLTGLSYLDHSDLVYGLTYYYIVRAEDSTDASSGPANGGNEDGNLVRRSGTPVGHFEPGPNFVDDVEPAAEPGYQTFSTRDAGGWQVLTDPTAHSASQAWVALDDQPGVPELTQKDDRLTLPPLNLTATSVMSFWHNFDFARFATATPETAYQSGGVLELSVDGDTWIDLGPWITQGEYNGVVDVDAQNPLAGRPAWVGSSDNNLIVGRNDAMTQVVVDLGEAIADQYGASELGSVRVRFRLGGTFQVLLGGVQGSGWGVDDLQVTNLLEPGVCLASSGLVPATLALDKVGPGVVRLAWDSSCASGAEDYAIYEGTIGDWYSHTMVDCADDGGDLEEDIAAGPGNRYFLVVPFNAASEGSYGADSAGVERPRGEATCAVEQVAASCP